MKTALLAFALIATGSAAHADIIKCSFTEPFVTTIYSMSEQTLTIKGEQTKVIKNVSFQIKGAGHFVLLDSKGKLLQDLKLTNDGSDGMSDRVFPFEVKDMLSQGMANSGVGGCESNSLKSKIGS